MDLHDAKTLRAHLTFIYRVIVASEELLSMALATIAYEDDDSFSDRLYDFYSKHLREEREHADWLRDDLGDVREEIDWTAACVAGSQYYLIKHVHPALLLGYMQALEVPAPMKLIDDLEYRHGKKIMRTWRHHATVDGKHSEEIANLIALAPLALQEKIEQNRKATIALWNSVTARYSDA